MVLESLFSVKRILRRPLNMLVFSIVISFASIYIANFVFPEATGYLIPAFITIAMAPIIYRIFVAEEEVERKEAEHKINIGFFGRHEETILLFTLFFIGNFIAIFVVALISPEEFVTSAFAPQIKTIEAMSSFPVTGSVLSTQFIQIIILNNLKVMAISFVLSFLLVVGALYVLSWNASILALYLASFIRHGLYETFFEHTLGILPHAPVELLAYFLAGIGGAILSVGMIREKLMSREFFLILKDSMILLALAVIAVIIGAFLEVFL